MTTLVTGGSGFLGAHVVRALIERGDAVRCLVRTSGAENLAGLDVEEALGDLRDPASLMRAVDGCAAVFHCAADYRLYARDPKEIYATNVDGTRLLLEACRVAHVGDVVVTSSVGALAASRGEEPADEQTPVSVDDMIGHYKRSKFLAELEVQRAVADGQRVFLVHPSTPIGEFDVRPTPTGQIIVDFLRGRIPVTVDTGLNFVDVRDVAAGHLLVQEQGRLGRRYILGNENLTLEQFLGVVAGVSGLAPVTRRIPHALPLVVGAIDTGFARLLGREPRVAFEAVRMARKKMFFDCSRARTELGYSPGPVVDAVERAVSYFKQRGLAPQASGK